MGTQRLVVGSFAHADNPSPATVALVDVAVAGKVRRMTSAIAARSTDGSAPAGPRSRARSARAASPGGLLALRSSV